MRYIRSHIYKGLSWISWGGWSISAVILTKPPIEEAGTSVTGLFLYMGLATGLLLHKFLPFTHLFPIMRKWDCTGTIDTEIPHLYLSLSRSKIEVCNERESVANEDFAPKSLWYIFSYLSGYPRLGDCRNWLSEDLLNTAFSSVIY